MSTFNKAPNNNYSVELEQYRQSGDICAFLELNGGFLLGFDHNIHNILPAKFAALETAGFHLSSSSNSILEMLIPSMIRQFTVTRCLYDCEYQLMIEAIGMENRGSGYGLKIMANLLIPALVAILAVLFNISLLIVSARKISMSTVCNWLLVFDSLCQIPALMPFIENLFGFYGSFISVDYRVCLVSQMLSIGSSYAAFLAIYFISLERLLIVMMTMRMSQLSEKAIKRYSLLSMLACTCAGVAMVLSVFNVRMDTNIQYYGIFLSCNTELYEAVNSENYGYVSLTILCFVMFNYVLIAGLIAWRRIYVPSTQSDSNNNSAYTQATYRMLRSVFIITLVLLIGWLFGYVLSDKIRRNMDSLSQKIAQALFPDDYEKAWTLTIDINDWLTGLASCLFPIAAGLNAPVLIINNSEYRQAYKKMLAPFFRICRKRTSTVAAVGGVGPLFINHQHHHHQ